MGVALGAREISADLSPAERAERFEAVCAAITATRPTAVNLFWAAERMRRVFAEVREQPWPVAADRLAAEARVMLEEDIACNRRMGAFGRELIPDGATVLTHCNAGALATGGYGTALGVIRAAAEGGKKIRVIADETRPYLQGARLTAWELQQLGIPVTVIADNMAGHLMASGEVQAVIVGADRIARNGDTANKIGTFMVAVLAQFHTIPFYVAAPVSTVDLAIPSGREIPIEERSPLEITHFRDQAVTPAGVGVRNPAFDVTPHRLIAAIVTDRGIARPPFDESLPRLAGDHELGC
jgi:methylthioribose-1-phosphate isomerase